MDTDGNWMIQAFTVESNSGRKESWNSNSKRDYGIWRVGENYGERYEL